MIQHCLYISLMPVTFISADCINTNWMKSAIYLKVYYIGVCANKHERMNERIILWSASHQTKTLSNNVLSFNDSNITSSGHQQAAYDCPWCRCRRCLQIVWNGQEQMSALSPYIILLYSGGTLQGQVDGINSQHLDITCQISIRFRQQPCCWLVS